MANSRFSGQTVLVAGGTGALGSAISTAFAQQGAAVIATYRAPAEFDRLKAAAAAAEVAIEGQRVDVTDEAAVRTLIEDLVTRHSRIDALVNAVGGYVGGSKMWEMDPQSLERMLSLNLRAAYVLSRMVVPVMLQEGHGCIINVAAKSAVDPAPSAATYAASKAAVLALMNSLAAELNGTGVRVNSILPSIIDTEANRSAMPKARSAAHWVTPAEIASVILFLCSAEAKAIDGAAIPVYGG
jgi:NAD(P)-dependent dehydrogenase (short-subunit alcohol dehydrogenase family)